MNIYKKEQKNKKKGAHITTTMCAMVDGAMSGTHRNRSTYKGLILYKDDKTHVKAMELIPKFYEYKAILHDRDIDEQGKPKKEHFHYIVKMPSCCPDSTLAKALNIKSNYIQAIVSPRGAYDYLTHKFTPEKYQYDNTCLFGGLKINIQENLDSEFGCIMKSIKENKISSMYELTCWCMANNCLDTLRKNSFLFSQIIKKF